MFAAVYNNKKTTKTITTRQALGETQYWIVMGFNRKFVSRDSQELASLPTGIKMSVRKGQILCKKNIRFSVIRLEFAYS